MAKAFHEHLLDVLKDEQRDFSVRAWHVREAAARLAADAPAPAPTPAPAA